MIVGQFDGVALAREFLAEEAAPQNKVETLTVEFDSIIYDLGPIVGKPDLRQRVDQCRGQIVRQAEIGAQARIAVGRVAIIVGGGEAARSEIEGEAAGLKPQFHTRSEGVRHVVTDIGLHQF